ncbi:hypothetical protein C8R43DRAFT_948373 [Mycena crocata]|nr:hypothetical protein C8R43DRAFT_948373 [Mycena crocata]
MAVAQLTKAVELGDKWGRKWMNTAQTMPPTPVQSTADCQTIVTFATQALSALPCLRCLLLGSLAVFITLFLIWLALPTRLCKKMEACLNTAERLYHGTIIAGLVSSSFQLELDECLHR